MLHDDKTSVFNQYPDLMNNCDCQQILHVYYKILITV